MVTLQHYIRTVLLITMVYIPMPSFQSGILVAGQHRGSTSAIQTVLNALVSN